VRLYRSTTKVDARNTTTPLLAGRVHLARPRSNGLSPKSLETLAQVSEAWADVPAVELTRRKRDVYQEHQLARDGAASVLRGLTALSQELPAFLRSARQLELNVEPLLVERLEELAMDLYVAPPWRGD
jgi:uncharacterized membrane protein